MDKHVFFFQDENLSAEKALNGTLKIIAGVDGLSMLALGSGNEILGLESIVFPDKKLEIQHFEAAFQEILSGNRLLKFTFGTIRTALSVPLVTLVPNRLFTPHEYGQYFHLLQPNGKEAIFGHEGLDTFGCVLVWGAPLPFQRFVNRYQPRSLAASLIRNYHTLASQDGHSIFMNIRGNTAQITVFDLRSLVFYNAFEFNKPADLLYFVLLVFDQFRINPEQVPLHVSGALFEGSEHYKMLYKYIQSIKFITPKVLPDMPKSENALPAHYWFDLLSL